MKKLILILLSFFIVGKVSAENTYSPGSATFDIISTAQDVYKYSTCDSNIATGTIVYTDTTRYIYLRFVDVNIPSGATITSAKLTVYPASGLSGATVKTYLLDYDDCTTITTCALDETETFASHVLTSDWPTADASNGPYDITGLADVIQAWVDRAGHTYNQDIGLKLTGSGSSRTIRLTGSTEAAPVLTVEYTGGDPALDVYMSDPDVKTDQYIQCWAYNAAATDKLVVKLDGEIQYNQAIGGSGEKILADVLLDYTSLTAGAHTIDIYITDTDAVEYTSSHFDHDWTTLHNGAPAVGINKDNALIIGGGHVVFPDRGFL